MREAIAITGVGAVCSAGTGAEHLRRLLYPAGRAFHHTTRFRDALSIPFGVVPGHDEPMGDLPDGAPQRLCVAFAVQAAREALGPARTDPARIGLVVGSNLEDHPQSLAALTAAIADAVGIRGPCSTVSVACASSLLAIDVATMLLRRRDVDVVLAGGSDVLTPRVVAGFRLLGLLSDEPCTPFGDVLGTSLGEGAAFVRLERSSADAIAYVVGYGESCDAYHLTRPDPSGRGVARAVRAAFAQFGVAPTDVDYVGAHATGTVANDVAEVRGLSAAFAGRLPPVTATKSLIGHAQGASGALELAVTLAGSEARRIPPSVLQSHRRGIDLSIPQPSDPPREHRIALRCSSGFGGANCAILVGRSPLSSRDSRSAGAAIVCADAICGSAVGAEGLRDALHRGDRLDAPPTVDLRRIARHHDATRHDPSTAWLTAVVARCIEDLGDADLDRTALVVVQSWSSSQTMQRLSDRIREQGLGRMSAHAFAHSLNVAPAGTCAELLGIRGGLEVFNGGAATGLFGLGRAAALLHDHDGLVRVLTVAVHEPRDAGDGAVGAVCLRVERDGPTRLVGIATAGPHDAGSAVRHACEATDVRARADTVLVVGDGPEPDTLRDGPEAVRIAARGPVAGLGACLAAASPGRTLVVGTSAGALSCALVLDRHG